MVWGARWWWRASVLSSTLKDWRSSAGMNTKASVALNMWPCADTARVARGGGMRALMGANAAGAKAFDGGARSGEREGAPRVRGGATCLERENDGVGAFAQPERRLEDEIDPHDKAWRCERDSGGSHVQVGYGCGASAARQAKHPHVSERGQLRVRARGWLRGAAAAHRSASGGATSSSHVSVECHPSIWPAAGLLAFRTESATRTWRDTSTAA